jgi:hypothetical protein
MWKSKQNLTWKQNFRNKNFKSIHGRFVDHRKFYTKEYFRFKSELPGKTDNKTDDQTDNKTYDKTDDKTDDKTSIKHK